MRYVVETNLRGFEAWSGGRDTIEDAINADVIDDVESYIEMICESMELEEITETFINDLLWFDDEIKAIVYGEDDDE